MGKFLKAAADDLSLYVRHSAWLGAAPDKAESDRSTAPSKTRAQRLKDAVQDEDFQPDMPDPGSAAYLLACLWRVGPKVGDREIADVDLRHYQDNEGISLSPWECSTLRRLSIDYLNESHRATKPDCPPPFADSTDAARLKEAELQRNLDTFFS